MRLQEVDIGLAADIGTLAHLPKITCNNSLARELAYTARPFSAAEAEKLGLVSKVVQGSREEVVSAALELAKCIAQKSPLAVAGTKRLLIHSRDHSYVLAFAFCIIFIALDSVPENLEYTSVWNGGMMHTEVSVFNVPHKNLLVSQLLPGHE